VRDTYERAGIAVAVWETTTDVGIPSFLCTIIDRAEDPLRLLYSTAGMGCHPARHVALLRALTEAAQSRLTLIAGSRDDFLRSDYERYRSPDVLRHARAQMDVKGPMRNFHDGPTWDGETFDEDVAWELNRLRAVGIERVVVVDLTKPEFRLPVVRVVIPGLEGVSSLPGYVHGARAQALIEGCA
jgi:ribosomal protein S12 methylthiotransferase accessory factor